MSWQHIDGWFTEDDAEAYRRIVAELPQRGGHIVEIGTWMGRSAACLIELCQAAHKSPLITTVDTFTGSEETDPKLLELVKANGGNIFHLFAKNIEPYNYGHLNPCIGRSVDIAKTHKSKSLNAVFVDGDHSYMSASSDIKAWLPKIKTNGIMAGHDIDYTNVERAVTEHLGSYEKYGRCWLVRIT